MRLFISLFSLLLLFNSSYARKKAKEKPMELTSSAFTNGGMIPTLYGYKGKNISPPLSWTNAPENVKSFALICDDPDAPAGAWIHWILYNIPADTLSLDENVPKRAKLGNGAVHGLNSWHRSNYDGPCPPSGTHRYFFRLYALDKRLPDVPGISRAKLDTAMKGHILAKAELMGKFSR